MSVPTPVSEMQVRLVSSRGAHHIEMTSVLSAPRLIGDENNAVS